MKKTLFALYWLVVFFAGCGGTTHTETQLEILKIPLGKPPKHFEPKETSDLLTIASWNIQTFGKTKAGTPEVLDVIAKTIARFDLAAVQGIRDNSGSAMVTLEEAVDALGADYEVIVGSRLGHSQVKEQYAYLFRSDKLQLLDSFTPPDPDDFFHREPFVAWFKSKNGNFDFVLITIQTDPDTATKEIEALPGVVESAQEKIPLENDFIVLGDYNSDCSYYQEPFILGHPFLLLITDSMDTNVALSDCTYDRIVVTETTDEDFADSSGVFKFDAYFDLSMDEAKKVSDHYPAYAVFYINNDSD